MKSRRRQRPVPTTAFDASAAKARIELLATALNLSSDFVLLVDRVSMRCLDANEEWLRMRGIRRDQMLFAPPWTLGGPWNEKAPLEDLYDRVIAAAPEPLRTTEERYHAAMKRRIHCDIQRQAIRAEGRWVICITGRDITQRLKAEQEIRSKVEALARSNQELEQFAYIASHDLSEPLRTVASYAQLLERRYSHQFDKDARDFMAYIVGGVQRMKALMDGLLLYSRAGRPDVALHPIQLDQALDHALTKLALAVQNSNAVVEREPLPSILGDTTGMTQVFENLIGNALSFQAEGKVPHVKVSARDEGAAWVVEVQDDGIGIEARYFPRIFMIFQNLHSRDRSRGAGIGLAICKKVVERHGGRMSVSSEPGRGTTFAVHLPKLRLPDDEAEAAGGADKWDAQASGHPLQ